MPAGNNSEHRNSYRTHTNDDDSKQTEHEAEDKAEHKNGDKVHHQPASNGDGQSVDHFTKFSTELKGINDQAAAVFDPKGNIASYPPETRKEFVNAYVSTFNATFNTDSREQLNERWEAAREISHNLFKPLYEEVETKQALSHLDFSDETAKALTEHQVDTVRYITNTPRADGTTVDYKDVKEIEFTVSSIEEATKIMEASGGQAYIVDPAALDHRREEFYLLLYSSSADPDTATNYMNMVLEEAISYTNGDSYNEPEPTSFDTLFKQKDLQVLDSVLAANIKTMSHMSKRATDTLSYQGDPEAAGANTAYLAHLDIYHEAFTQALETADQETYNKLTEKLAEHDQSFSQAIENNTGFVKAENFEQPELKGSFNSTNEALNYISDVEEALTNLDYKTGDIPPENYFTIQHMKTDYKGQLDYIQATQEVSEDSPDLQNAAQDFTEDYQVLHKIAEGVNYLLKPIAQTPEREPALAGV